MDIGVYQRSKLILYRDNNNNGAVVMAQRLRHDLISDPVIAARTARERLQSEGELPGGYLRDEIEASWRRSLEAGLNCSNDKAQNCDEVNDLPLFREQHELLLHVAMPEFEQLSHQFGADGLILLGNADSRILAIDGNDEIITPARRLALRQGVSWSEDNRGTNAIGTAVVERRPILINEEEHFLDTVSHFSCTSAPIMDASGNLTGVIDITRVGRNRQPQDTLGVVQLAARNIEARLFTTQYQNQIVLAFHPRRHYLRSAWLGLVALDESGKLLAINEHGCQLLGHGRKQIVGRMIEELVSDKIGALLTSCLREPIVSVQTKAGELFCELLQFPKRLTAATSTTHLPQKPAKRTPSVPTLEEFSAGEPRLLRAFKMASRALDHDVPVLLKGETGTGKEVAAQVLHHASSRSQKPLVAVNCAAIPEGLIESELFGYREGAFTGSRKGGMVGRFQQANGGTLFLDEIGDMPLSLQARLLRVLQDRKVEPLGGGNTVDLDIALIGASHRNLKQLVAEGRFREDLFFRLSGVSIRLPAVRDRQDFPGLCQQLLRKLNRTDVQLDPALKQRLADYAWPGNVRQLEMVLKVALAFMDPDEHTLTEEHLSDDFLDELEDTPIANGTLQETQGMLIRQALEQHGSNVSSAAKALGISRATLYRRMKTFNLA